MRNSETLFSWGEGRGRTQTNLLASYENIFMLCYQRFLNKDTTEIQDRNGTYLFKSLFKINFKALKEKKHCTCSSVLQNLIKA